VRAAAPLAAALLLAAAAPAAAVTIESGSVEPFRGVAGASLGMTRAQVIDELGPPREENRNGVMTYARRGIFDVYRTGPGLRTRVEMLIAAGPGFCTAEGACSTRAGSLRKMLDAYPKRFTRYKDGTGDTIFRWCRRIEGRAVSTSFNVDLKGGRILTWFIVDEGRSCPSPARLGLRRG
jgi:hypothetical protein